MRQVFLMLSSLLLLLLPVAAFGQSFQETSVPRLIAVSGTFRPADGRPAASAETITLSIYADQQGGTPLWQETQNIAVDAQGRYSLLLGATRPDGIPAEVFGGDEAHWLGTVFERGGEVEGVRQRFTSVPYAIRAADADTLGGRPASAYLLAPSAGGTAKGSVGGDSEAQVTAAGGSTTDVVLPGTPNFLAKYVNGADVGSSGVFEVADGAIGMGTTTPFDRLHIRYNNNTGDFTGLAVQNMNPGALAYSGMLFYDHTNALTQFQGYNNATHEYRSNNIARVSPGGAFNGSINFMIGGTSRFFVGSLGTIGIGTTAPFSLLDVSNAASSLSFAQVTATTYAPSGQGSLFVGRKARGTAAAPSAVLNGDVLTGLLGRGHGTTNFFGTGYGGMFVRAAENFTDTAQGTRLSFDTTATGTTVPMTRMTLTDSGNLGIGTGVPQNALEVVRNGNSITALRGFGTDVAAGVLAQIARGTQAAPAAAQAGDPLGFFVAGSWDGASFDGEGPGMIGVAAENWTPTAHGCGLVFYTTPIGLTEAPDDGPIPLIIMPSGDIGIGMVPVNNNFPTATDKLQVVGDIRVGTSGTNGCLKNFAGTGLIGTCSSDRRLKKNITPVGPVLDQLASLQPVHYFWRAADFPEQHFGNSQNLGLIAQDVEQVLPELVETDRDGFKAVNYSALPLLTIQAVKELKAENDALKQRLSDLERVISDMLARQK